MWRQSSEIFVERFAVGIEKHWFTRTIKKMAVGDKTNGQTLGTPMTFLSSDPFSERNTTKHKGN